MSGTQGHSRRGTPLDRAHVLLALAVFLACVAAYAPALQGPFFFDDTSNLLQNPLLRIDGLFFDDWRAAIISNDSGPLHRPVAMATFAANHVVAGGFSMLQFKGTNLALHLLTGLLVYCLSRALLRAPALEGRLPADPARLALAAAAIWLLHPLHVSTVLYVVQRMAQLSTLFSLLGLLVFCRYRARWAESGASAGELIAAGLWLVLITAAATLSKENGALLPWLIVVVEVTLYRGAWAGGRRPALARLAWVALVLPLVLVCGVLLLAPDLVLAGYAGREFGPGERLLTQGRLLWHYLGWVLLPNITAMGFFHDDIALSRGLLSPLTSGLSLLAWAVAVATAVRLRATFPLLLFALLFYLVGHAMESSILPLEMVFEHRNYLPSVGLCLLAVVLVYQLAARLRAIRPPVLLLVALIVVTAQLVLRVQAWTDELSLARFNVVNHPESPRANFYYGNTLFTRFARAGELGLGEEEKQALAVASRTHFLRTYKLDASDMPALVMLYQLDTLYFPKLAEENDWLGRVEALAGTKRLNSSDHSALAALVAFAASDGGRADLPRVIAVLEQLLARFPGHAGLVAMHYQVQAARPAADRQALRAYLEDAIGRSPGNRQLYPFLIQHHGAEDMSVTYDTARAWLLLDARRRELPILRRVFAP